MASSFHIGDIHHGSSLLYVRVSARTGWEAQEAQRKEKKEAKLAQLAADGKVSGESP